MRNAMKKFAALGIVAALSVSVIAPTAFAAPVGTRAAQFEQSFTGSVIDVQWRRGRWIAPAIAGAIIGGAIIAGSQQPYYDPYYNAPPPGYYQAQPQYYQAPPPAYYEPSPRSGPRQCWVESGPNGATGYWSPC
jgi:hypothetical protein